MPEERAEHSVDGDLNPEPGGEEASGAEKAAVEVVSLIDEGYTGDLVGGVREISKDETFGRLAAEIAVLFH